MNLAALGVATVATIIVAQSPATSMVGTWIAQFEGQTFVRLELSNVNGTVRGGIAVGNFELDSAGIVRRASEPPPALKPIMRPEQRGSTVMFAALDTDDEDRFVFELLDAGRATLTLLLSDEDREELAAAGIAPPRPITLLKQ